VTVGGITGEGAVGMAPLGILGNPGGLTAGDTVLGPVGVGMPVAGGATGLTGAAGAENGEGATGCNGEGAAGCTGAAGVPGTAVPGEAGTCCAALPEAKPRKNPKMIPAMSCSLRLLRCASVRMFPLSSPKK
jgi:hypothetical protein